MNAIARGLAEENKRRRLGEGEPGLLTLLGGMEADQSNATPFAPGQRAARVVAQVRLLSGGVNTPGGGGGPRLPRDEPGNPREILP